MTCVRSVIKSTSDKKKKKAHIDEVISLLPEIMMDKISRADLLDNLMETFDCKKNTIIERIKTIISDELIIEGSEVNYTLQQSKKGKEVYYFLAPINSKKDQQDTTLPE